MCDWNSLEQLYNEKNDKATEKKGNAIKQYKTNCPYAS